MAKLMDKTDILKLHSKIYVGNLLIKMYYPSVIAFLNEKVGADARERLFQIGQEVGRGFMNLFNPKTTDVKKMIYKFYKLMWNTTKNVKVKVIKGKHRIFYHVIDKKCGLCDPETVLEGLDIPCASIGGYLDACLEHISKISPLPSYKVQTIKSINTGDPHCEHVIEIAR